MEHTKTGDAPNLSTQTGSDEFFLYAKKLSDVEIIEKEVHVYICVLFGQRSVSYFES